MLQYPASTPGDERLGERERSGLARQLRLPTRRSFLWKLLLPASLGGLLATTTEAAVLPGLRSRQTRHNLEEIRNNVHGQAQFIADTIVQLGGEPRPKPIFQGVRQRNRLAFLLLARATANGGVAAAHNGATSAFSKELLTLGARVAAAEARHAAYLNALLGQPLLGTSSGVEEFHPEEVLSLKATFLKFFVADLNGGPPAEFDRSQPSPENDLLIANAGLLLKMFEAELYDLNLARFFR